MRILTDHDGRVDETARLVGSTFTASEGMAEGALIAGLVRGLFAATPDEDLVAYLGTEEDRLIGAMIFSRLVFDGDPRTAFLLGPAAVATDRQGGGIGQTLLRQALADLATKGVEVAFTYGNPAYYGKVGFRQITVADASPPRPLSQPHGWLAQSLTDRPMDPFRGESRCVPALDDPAYW